MRALVYRNFGSPDILKYEEIDRPTPGDDEVLVKVRAASINPLDWKIMKGGPWMVRLLLGLGKPEIRRPGVDVAGEVEAVGRNVTQLQPGDAVFGACRGAFAEYTTARAAGKRAALVRKPESVTFEQAASAPVAGLTALQGLRDHGRIRAGQSVLVHGAAGGVGTFAVQIARAFGANVTGVCSTRNVEMVRSIGADRVVDYAREDFTKSAECYDLILDCVGNQSLSVRRRVLKPTGRLVMVGAPADVPLSSILAGVIGAIVWSMAGSRKMVFFIARFDPNDLTILGELMASGKVQPVIDRTYRLSEAAEAFRYMEAGHARGKVIVSPEG
jgi:NADPH:quinone reductase-like Zn-dependent oxidoreductase